MRRDSNVSSIAGSVTGGPPVTGIAMAGIRDTSSSSSFSSQTLSNSSRVTSSSSSTSSRHSRPPSAQSNVRPQSALVRNRSTIQHPLPVARPSTSQSNHVSGSERSAPGKRPGKVQAPLYTPQAHSGLQVQKPRSRETSHALVNRDTSAFAATDRKLSDTTSKTARVSSLGSLCSSMNDLRISSVDAPVSTERLEMIAEDSACPKTPSQIPRRLAQTPASTMQHSKTPSQAPIKPSPSRKTFIYLTRESNTPVLAWDTKGRLDDMQTMYDELKEKMTAGISEKNGVNEMINLYKTRSMSIRSPLQYQGLSS